MSQDIVLRTSNRHFNRSLKLLDDLIKVAWFLNVVLQSCGWAVGFVCNTLAPNRASESDDMVVKTSSETKWWSYATRKIMTKSFRAFKCHVLFICQWLKTGGTIGSCGPLCGPCLTIRVRPWITSKSSHNHKSTDDIAPEVSSRRLYVQVILLSLTQFN